MRGGGGLDQWGWQATYDAPTPGVARCHHAPPRGMGAMTSTLAPPPPLRAPRDGQGGGGAPRGEGAGRAGRAGQAGGALRGGRARAERGSPRRARRCGCAPRTRSPTRAGRTADSAEDAGCAGPQAPSVGRGRPGVPARGRRARAGPGAPRTPGPGRAEVSGHRGGGGRGRRWAGTRRPVGAFVCGARGPTPRPIPLRADSGQLSPGAGARGSGDPESPTLPHPCSGKRVLLPCPIEHLDRASTPPQSAHLRAKDPDPGEWPVVLGHAQV